MIAYFRALLINLILKIKLAKFFNTAVFNKTLREG